MNHKLFFTAIFLFSAATMALEPNKPAAKTDFLKNLDKNADGKVSKEEFFASMEKKFHSMDVDKSDAVSIQELKIYGEKDPAAKQKAQQAAKLKKIPEKSFSKTSFAQLFITRAEQEFAALDKNHDNELTANEVGVSNKLQKKNAKAKHKNRAEKNISKSEFITWFTEPAKQKFTEFDKNHDGTLTETELEMPNSKTKPVKPASTPTPPKKQLTDKTTEKQKLLQSFFVGIDANKDGQISSQEKNAAFTRLFNRLDTNHNQVITPDEILAGRHPQAVNHP